METNNRAANPRKVRHFNIKVAHEIYCNQIVTVVAMATNVSRCGDVDDMWGGGGGEAVCASLREADVPCSPCLDIADAIAHEQVQACATVQEQQHPLLGGLRSPAHPARFGGQRRPALAPLGALGEHTDEVLAELGYDAQSIVGLREKGVAA